MKKILLVLVAVVSSLSLSAQQDTNKTSTTIPNTNTQRLISPHHFTMSLGYGFMFKNDHDAILENYYSNSSHSSKMRHGINYEFAYDYNFHKNMACGLVFNMYNSFDSYYLDNNAMESSSDDKWIFFVGPSFMGHTNMLDSHWSLFAKATVGLMKFHNAQRVVSLNGQDNSYNSSSATYKRYLLGYGLSVGANYYINEFFSLEGSIGYMGGTAGKLKEADQTHKLSEKENLSRLNVLIGLKVKL